MLSVVWIAAFFLLSSPGEARICYNCTGDCVRDSEECKGSCTTSIPELGGNEIRSCIEDTMDAGCVSKVIDGVNHKVCYCNTERCNHATTFHPTPPSLMYLMLIVPLLAFRLR